jgi:hypothetical protein
MAVTEGTLTFFERESLPSHQRPYELLFQPPDSDFPVCNYNVVQVPNVPIHDLRPLKDKLSLDREGFLVADFNTSMNYEDYFDQEKLKSTYMPEIKAFLKDRFGVRAAYIHECVVSSLKSGLDAKRRRLSWVDSSVRWKGRSFWPLWSANSECPYRYGKRLSKV